MRPIGHDAPGASGCGLVSRSDSKAAYRVAEVPVQEDILEIGAVRMVRSRVAAALARIPPVEVYSSPVAAGAESAVYSSPVVAVAVEAESVVCSLPAVAAGVVGRRVRRGTGGRAA